MQIHDVCYLLRDDPDAHGVFDAHDKLARRVFCQVRSVSMSEMYQARAQGLSPQFRLFIPHEVDYAGERSLLFQGVRYDVIRSYTGEEDGIELTVQRSVHQPPAGEECGCHAGS